jgi:hypothetical protein
MSKILVAMSGGVDSAVAAFLLKEQGHDIAGAYMKNWVNEEKIEAHCPWEEDIADANAVCEHLGIPFQVCNFMRDYHDRVVEYLIDGYRRGITPNPDVMCNREMKFGVLRDFAHKNGFEGVATGHYARRLPRADGRGMGIFEGVDKNKDQSYFLAMVHGEQLTDAYFPVGHLLKPAKREEERQSGDLLYRTGENFGLSQALHSGQSGRDRRYGGQDSRDAPGPAFVYARSAARDAAPVQHERRALRRREEGSGEEPAGGGLRPSGVARAFPDLDAGDIPQLVRPG